VSPPAERIVVVGDAGLDVVVRSDSWPAAGSDARATITVEPGGAGANTAAWLAALGGDPLLLARVGADPAAAQVRGSLAAAGVRTALTVDPDAATCCVVVLVDPTGQRTMLADRGAAARFSPADVGMTVLAGARHLHLSGYVLLDPSSRPGGLAALIAARDAGLTTSVDPQAAALLADPTGFLDAVRGADLLLPSSAELAALTGSTDPGSAAGLLDVVGAVAVTAGERGATWVGPGISTTVPAVRIEPVDTTGAGDAFDAGLLLAWLAGASPAEALRAGADAGARAVCRVGARPAR